ncbi:unnamed protein product, partial [Phaeothamnion confervicola]
SAAAAIAAGASDSKERSATLPARVEAAYARLVGPLRKEQWFPAECMPLMAAADATQTKFRRSRHIVQQASIIGHMMREGLLNGSGSGDG